VGGKRGWERVICIDIHSPANQKALTPLLSSLLSPTPNTRKQTVTLFCLLIVNNINLIAGNFITLTSAASYMYFMAYQISVVVIGLNCVTSFFIGNLSSKLVEELEVRVYVYVC